MTLRGKVVSYDGMDVHGNQRYTVALYADRNPSTALGISVGGCLVVDNAMTPLEADDWVLVIRQPGVGSPYIVTGGGTSAAASESCAAGIYYMVLSYNGA